MLDKKRCPFPTRSPMLATTTTPFASPNPPSSVGFTQAPAIFCPGCFILVSLRSARQFRGNTFTLPYVHCIPFFLMYVAHPTTPHPRYAQAASQSLFWLIYCYAFGTHLDVISLPSMYPQFMFQPCPSTFLTAI